jgi:hypothetical protein
MSGILAGFKNTVTEVEKKSQYFFLLFFDRVAENISRLRHRAWFVFEGLAAMFESFRGNLNEKRKSGSRGSPPRLFHLKERLKWAN